MKNGANNAAGYSWPQIKTQLTRAVTYATGSSFNYRYQLRIKATPASVHFTFWDYAQCIHSGQHQGSEASAWNEFLLNLQKKGISALACVGVGVSVWSNQPVLLRPESKAAVALDAVNRALRTQPETVRRDLQPKGPYAYTAMAWDAAKIVVFGLPVSHILREGIAKLPGNWARAVWFGPCAIPFFQATTGAMLYHTVLTRSGTVSLMTENGTLRFFQQDRTLMEDQPISQDSLTKLKSVYNYFPKGQIVHRLYPVEVSPAWAGTLRRCLQSMNCAADVRIGGTAKLKFPNITDDVSLQDMFPGGTPWSTT